MPRLVWVYLALAVAVAVGSDLALDGGAALWARVALYAGALALVGWYARPGGRGGLSLALAVPAAAAVALRGGEFALRARGTPLPAGYLLAEAAAFAWLAAAAPWCAWRATRAASRPAT